MTESAPTHLEIRAELERPEIYSPRTRKLWRALDYLWGYLPAYRNTRSGRQRARQGKVMLVVVGVGTMIFGGSAALIALGALVAFVALVAPVRELKKRSVHNRLRTLAADRKRPVRRPGKVVFDGRRLELHDEQTMLRRVLVDRPGRELVFRVRDDKMCAGLRPRSGNKRQAIWICAPELTLDDVPVAYAGGLARLSDQEVDAPAFIDPDDWRRLIELLGEVVR
ncbi:hypothetical protein DL240_11085 [Lujinxingia litoralis]|uniref:Uncharacterized protein n=1 Tax=Lujinxingia litoralis TaxID=2211119 RepID=A0A328C5V7_9DELT|nr:hypothetical protein [Lujinxingia litoralis]RAL22386.1 hypothetical protein DL240_11085 [Lujinxingia litoralis]